MKMLRDGKMREEEGRVAVDASGWAVGWVVLTQDETSTDAEERGGSECQEGMDALEDIIDSDVPMSSDPPTFDNAGVVTVNEDMLLRAEDASEG
jgi:hypothetical protein